MVYGTNPKEWTGRHHFISTTKDTAVLKMDRGISIFCYTCVELFAESILPEGGYAKAKGDLYFR